jgi:hypothetical protein
MNKMSEQDRAIISKVQAILIQIDAVVKVFFNVANYTKLGLVYSTAKHALDSSGNDTIIGYDWHLTDKARQYIKVCV